MRTGEVVQIGQHRLMCGDAGNPEHVAALFDGAKPDLVFTSPPYLQQRAYDRAIGCWDTMMQRVFGTMPWHDTTQVLVNLGIVHRKGEWLPYWDGWIEWMRTQGWRRFGLYVWDKRNPTPGVFGGRPAPAFEFIFHFNRNGKAHINRTVPCKTAGSLSTGSGNRRTGSGKIRKRIRTGIGVVQPFKIPSSLFSIATSPNKSGHPASFPIALPSELLKAYTQNDHTFYDPFCGSGTSIIAAEQTGRIAYGMEISPDYCRIAVERIRKAMAQPRQGALAL